MALCVLGTNILGSKNYVAGLNLQYFMNATLEALLGLAPLTYLLNYFDTLPMYMGALLLTPIAMLLARTHPWLPIAGSLALYLGNWALDGGFWAHPKQAHLE